jgi:dihydrofolate reductase
MAASRKTKGPSGRKVRYGVAMSLDGYIAGPDGEANWIVHDPEIDFKEIFSRFDTLLIGRKTFEAMLKMGGGRGSWPGMQSFVISRTLKQADHRGVTIAKDARALVTDLKTKPGKDIWLFGGGELFRSLLGDGLVDAVDVGIIPVLLGRGIPLLPSPAVQTKLRLGNRRVYEKSGIVVGVRHGARSAQAEAAGRLRPQVIGRRTSV